MQVYAFLDPAATDYVSGVRWPVPEEPGPGAWLEARAGSPLRGYPPGQLLWWLDQHLWEVELGGEVRATDRSMLGARGRLLAPVHAWTPDVARFEEHIVTCPPCRTHLEQMRRTIDVVGRIPDEALSPDAEQDLLAAFRTWKRG